MIDYQFDWSASVLRPSSASAIRCLPVFFKQKQMNRILSSRGEDGGTYLGIDQSTCTDERPTSAQISDLRSQLLLLLVRERLWFGVTESMRANSCGSGI